MYLRKEDMFCPDLFVVLYMRDTRGRRHYEVHPRAYILPLTLGGASSCCRSSSCILSKTTKRIATLWFFTNKSRSVDDLQFFSSLVLSVGVAHAGVRTRTEACFVLRGGGARRGCTQTGRHGGMQGSCTGLTIKLGRSE
jgi:hypothetical protein